MKIEDQVLSIEQMQHLKELGLEVKDTALVWYKDSICETVIFDSDGLCGCIPTLTLQEILALLPTDFLNYKEGDTEVIYGKNAELVGFSFSRVKSDNALNILDCAYKALCWCAENGHLNKE